MRKHLAAKKYRVSWRSKEIYNYVSDIYLSRQFVYIVLLQFLFKYINHLNNPNKLIEKKEGSLKIVI